MELSRHRTDYVALEQDVCGLYMAGESDATIDREFAQIQELFSKSFVDLKCDDDFEFTDWHDNIRMLWVYLYSDQFYDLEFLTKIKKILDEMERPWFAQFECSSPAIESRTNPNGAIGHFFLYGNSVVFDSNSAWDQIVPRFA